MSLNAEPLSTEGGTDQKNGLYGDTHASGYVNIHQGDNIRNYFLSCQSEEERDRKFLPHQLCIPNIISVQQIDILWIHDNKEERNF